MTTYVSYKLPAGFDYFQDIHLNPTDLASGLVLSRLDPQNFPSSGHVNAAIFGDQAKVSPWLQGTSVASVKVITGVGVATVSWSVPSDVAPASYVTAIFDSTGAQVTSIHDGYLSSTFSGLASGDYTATIVPLDDQGHPLGVTATAAFAVAGAPAPPPVQPYGQPASITATVNPDGSITLTWPPIAEVGYYGIEGSNDAGGYVYFRANVSPGIDGGPVTASSLTIPETTLVSQIGHNTNPYFGVYVGGRYIGPYNHDGVLTATTWTTGPVHIA